MNKPKLIVEGTDDLHLIANLLKCNGVDMDKKVVEIETSGSLEKLLESMNARIKAATEYPVGFVLDIDIELQDRWSAIKGRIGSLGIPLDVPCPESGFIAKIPDYQHRFGIWLMPDNKSSYGKLEHFVEQLVPSEDKLFPIARRSTQEAKKNGATFSNPDQIKAEVHTWLAWQREPGKPFGTALNARFLDPQSTYAKNFLRWIQNLFGLPDKHENVLTQL